MCIQERLFKFVIESLILKDTVHMFMQDESDFCAVFSFNYITHSMLVCISSCGFADGSQYTINKY